MRVPPLLLAPWLRTRLRRRGRDEQGYVAVLVAILLVPLIAMAAFAVDVGQWYVTAREAQRAADAAALAGVPYLPGDMSKAFSSAQALAADNGFADASDDVEVRTAIENTPTQLGVSVSRTVPNHFGRLLGFTDTTITRTAVADYAGPVPLGSPCNVFGNDPEGGRSSSVCEDVGQFWGNVGTLKASKSSGDAYQNGVCASGVSGCISGKNHDYDQEGYFYSVTLTEAVPRLVIQAFDPAFIHVADKCDAGMLKAVIAGKTVHAKDLGAKAVVSNPGERYAENSTPYCTGDQAFASHTTGFTDQPATSFVVRDPGPNAWDLTSFPVNERCEGTGVYPGFGGNLVARLDKTSTPYAEKPPPAPGLAPVATQPGYLAEVFRQWRTLCTIDDAAPGTYLVQVKTNGLGADQASGHNRFSLRAYSDTDADDNKAIAISGQSKMTIYANAIGATPEFYLARVPNGAAGQILNVELFDVGDVSAGGSGTITVVPPPDSKVSFTKCTGKGAFTGALTGCRLDAVSSSRYNGKWQTIAVEIPTGYTCEDTEPSACWVRLRYDYGAATKPADTTSWAASIQGDPVRLIR